MRLDGVAAIVTGGASGLGAATARMLASRGANVAVFDLDEEVAGPLIRHIDGLFCKVNVSDDVSLAEGLAKAEMHHGIARVLVNCAGVSCAIKTVGKGYVPHPLDAFRRTIEINLVGTFNATAQFAVRLAAWATDEEERGVVLSTASIAAFDGQIGQAAYASSKGGLVSMTLPLARDLAAHRIRVVTIAPGIFETPMLTGLPQEVQNSLGKQVPHPSRLGHPEEFAQLVEAVIANPMLNGEVIRLDGALRMGAR
jgi:NAD(P)-dependent dehydrogenase (short-subunit alcohol dehydrogenase family)